VFSTEIEQDSATSESSAESEQVSRDMEIPSIVAQNPGLTTNPRKEYTSEQWESRLRETNISKA
jgi:hypothetical protein